MTYSMTAFANARTPYIDNKMICWEIRSLNHRYLEIGMKCPEIARSIEIPLRQIVARYVKRGKIDISLTIEQLHHEATDFKLNLPLLQHIAAGCRQISETLPTNCQTNIELTRILNWPGLIENKAEDADALKNYLLQSFEQTIKTLLENRKKEGLALVQFIEQRLVTIEKQLAQLKIHLPAILENLAQQWRDRFDEMNLALDPTRLAQEMLIFAQKLDIGEELDRMVTHIHETRNILTQAEPIGRKLDFLMQEMNREVNTMGSKVSSSEATKIVIDLKVLLEQIREQIQNIE